jgi:hypothetical protein
MVRITTQKSAEAVQQLLDRVRITQQLSRSDYLYLTSLILADTSLNNVDRRRINRLFDNIQTGQLSLVD